MRYEFDLSIEAPDFTAALLAAIRALSQKLQARLMAGSPPVEQDTDGEAWLKWN